MVVALLTAPQGLGLASTHVADLNTRWSRPRMGTFVISDSYHMHSVAPDVHRPAHEPGSLGHTPRHAAVPPFEVARSFGMTVREVLSLPVMRTSRVLAGEAGLDRVVERLNMMEVPDILPWVRSGELLVTSGYPLRELTEDRIARMTRELSRRRLSGLCIKLGRYLEQLPASVIRAADRESFPILAMPVDLAFTDLLSAVLGELLERQERALRASDEIDRLLLQILLEGGGHSEVAGRLGQWLSSEVVIADPEGYVLAMSGALPSGPLFMPGERARLKVWTLPAEQPDVLIVDGTTVVAPIRAGSSTLGWLVTSGQDRPPTSAQLLAIRRAAPVVALIFSRVNEVRAIEARYRGDFLRDLLTGVSRPGDDPLQHAQMVGWDFSGDLVVGVAEPAGPVRETMGLMCSRIATALDHAISARWPRAAVHGYTAEIVMVLPAAASRELDSVLREARAHLAIPERRLRLGLSRPVAHISLLPTAYRQAREALHALRHRSGSGVIAFDDLGLTRMLAVLAESGEGERLVTDVLAPLLADRHGDQLLRTLECFLDNNCNVAETARNLHFHYNTIRQRIARIEELIGPFVDDAERRAELMTACKLRHMMSRRV